MGTHTSLEAIRRSYTKHILRFLVSQDAEKCTQAQPNSATLKEGFVVLLIFVLRIHFNHLTQRQNIDFKIHQRWNPKYSIWQFHYNSGVIKKYRQKSALRARLIQGYCRTHGNLPCHPLLSNLIPETLFLIPFLTVRLLINDKSCFNICKKKSKTFGAES